MAVGATAAAADQTHEVQSGDTLNQIAQDYDGVSWRDLYDANDHKLSDPAVIYPGQELSLPGASDGSQPSTYTVQAGDTLASVAAGTDAVGSWQELAEINSDIIGDPQLIRVGKELALTGDASGAAAEPQQTESAPEQTESAPAETESAPEPESDPEPQSAPETEGATGGNVSIETWDALAECESSGDWSINTGNGYYGGLQFAQSSWEWVGGSGMPHEASKQEQINRAEILLERQGWNAWPACSSQLGLR